MWFYIWLGTYDISMTPLQPIKLDPSQWWLNSSLVGHQFTMKGLKKNQCIMNNSLLLVWLLNCPRTILKIQIEDMQGEHFERVIKFRRGMMSLILCWFTKGCFDILWEEAGWVDCAFHDLGKAFDEIPNKQLMWKLEHAGELKRVFSSREKTSSETNRSGR